MLPTVEIGDRIVVNKVAYDLRVPFSEHSVVETGTPARGDVVVLTSPEDGKTLLKRVVAIPGDEVSVIGGRVWLNGKPVAVNEDENGLRELLGAADHPLLLGGGGGPALGKERVPSGQYLVLGDNRGDSHDGRAFGLVDRSAILGRAIAVYWRSGLGWHKL